MSPKSPPPAHRFNMLRWLSLAIIAVVLFIPNDWLNQTKGPEKSPPKSENIHHAEGLETPVMMPAIEAEKPPLVLLSQARIQCKVFEIVDGDTFTCDINGDGQIQRPAEKIRLLQVDTPETTRSPRNPTGEPQPFGLEAKRFISERVSGKTVTLVLDKKPRDRYGRTLAFVYPTDETEESLNEALIRAGLAKVMIYSPNYRLRDEIKALEANAQAESVGLWGVQKQAAR